MRPIAIGLLAVMLISGGAAAQTPGEQARLIRGFQMSLADYNASHRCLDMFPSFINATTPAPDIFPPPVALVFRQVIAKTLASRTSAAAIAGASHYPHPAVLQPFPPAWLQEFPRVLQEALPPLPAPLEYRLVGDDLVVRDAEAGLVVGVLKSAVGGTSAVRR